MFIVNCSCVYFVYVFTMLFTLKYSVLTNMRLVSLLTLSSDNKSLILLFVFSSTCKLSYLQFNNHIETTDPRSKIHSCSVDHTHTCMLLIIGNLNWQRRIFLKAKYNVIVAYGNLQRLTSKTGSHWMPRQTVVVIGILRTWSIHLLFC